MKRTFKILKRFFGVLASIVILFSIFYVWRVKIPAPKVDESVTVSHYKRLQTGKDSFAVGNNWLRKNKFGIWEMYLEGDAYERGLIYGVLAREHVQHQEKVFIDQVNVLVPNKFYQWFLKLFIVWFNRDIDKYIPQDELKEIYGISKSFSDEYDYVGPKFYRLLYYHGAHDMGHALNDFNLVGCTSFAVNREFSKDSTLLIGRNFDFYMGDSFAAQKLVIFEAPKNGYKFISYGWAGFIGVVSGMNEKGLTVTINAAKSDVPFNAKEPISLLAREILEHSSNITEAIDLAKKRETFVSESLLIGSASDNKVVVIEKSPSKMDVYESATNYTVCANHYQGATFMADSNNLKNIENSDSRFRFERLNELLKRNFPIDESKAANILRDKLGVGDHFIGYGNPKALNQMIGHHSVIFKPQQRLVWYSTQPYQLGEFVCYDLNKVFRHDTDVYQTVLNLPPDTFLSSADYPKYEYHKHCREAITRFVMLGIPMENTGFDVAHYIQSNPKSYITYMSLGNYFKKKNEFKKATEYYIQALQCEVASINEINSINKNIVECNKKGH